MLLTSSLGKLNLVTKFMVDILFLVLQSLLPAFGPLFFFQQIILDGATKMVTHTQNGYML